MQHVQLHRAWIPGGWCNAEKLACTEYYPHFKPYLLNTDHELLTGVGAIRRKEQLFAEYGPDEVFVRPDSVHKLFTGRVVYKDDFCDAIAPSRYNPTTLIVISTPKEIGREWRHVIVLDEIVASSQYRSNGAIEVVPGCPDAVLRFTSEVLDNVSWRPDAVFMLDVCESDDKLYVMELNSFSCSGLYACELDKVIRATSLVAENEWNVSHAA